MAWCGPAEPVCTLQAAAEGASGLILLFPAGPLLRNCPLHEASAGAAQALGSFRRSRADLGGWSARSKSRPWCSTVGFVRRGVRGHWRVEGLNRWQIAVEALHFHGSELSCASLRQGRGADVACKDVGITMHAQGLVLLGIRRVIPGTSRKLDHAPPDAVRDAYAGEAGAACVEDADDVPIGDTSGFSIVGMHACNLAPAVLGVVAMAAKVQLTVQSGCGLVGHQD